MQVLNIPEHFSEIPDNKLFIFWIKERSSLQIWYSSPSKISTNLDIEFNKFAQFLVCFVAPHKNIFLKELINSSLTCEYSAFLDKHPIISRVEGELHIFLSSFFSFDNFNSSLLSS